MNAAAAKVIAAVASDPENLKKILLAVGSVILFSNLSISEKIEKNRSFDRAV